MKSEYTEGETARRAVLMVGTDLGQRGGVASVLNAWKAAGFFERCNVRYVPSNGRAFGLGPIGAALRCYAICSWLLIARQVGLVHVHHSSYISFWRKAPVLAMAMLTRTPLVVSLHGGAFKDFYERLPRAARWWQRKIMRYAYRYLVLTKSWQDWASEVEPDARVEVIPNVVRRAPQPKPSYPDPADKPVLLFMGRVEALKGIRELVEALAMAYARGARWRLLMAGEGQIQQAIEDAHRLGLPSSAVECVGWVDEEMKDQLLRACSAVVLPSHVENMPVVLLEGFAYARPVVATCVGGIPDIVIDKKEGFLVPPRDAAGLSEALVALWNMSPSEKIEMGYAARRRYELLYSTTSVLTRLEEIYAIR